MKKISLVYLMTTLLMLLTVVSLFSDNVKALGSSFSLLIPDNYEDIKSFPDRLNLEESSHFEVGVNNGTYGTAFLGFSKIGKKFKSRHEFTLKNIEEQSSKVSTSYRKNHYLDTQNQFGFKIGGLNLGVLADIHDSEDGSESDSYNEHYPYDYSNISEGDRYSERYNYLHYYNVGISAGFGEKKLLSIALTYKYEESGDYEYRFNRNRKFEADVLTYESTNGGGKDYDEYYDEYSLSLIKDFGKELNSRFYSKLSYKIISEKYDVDYKFGDTLDHENNTESDMFHDWGDISDGIAYSLTIGHGNVKELNKLKIFTGFSAELIYEDLETNIFDDYDWQIVNEDSTESFHDLTSYDKTKKEYFAVLKLPFGLSYQITDWCEVTGSITLLADYYQYENNTTYESRFDKLIINATNNISVELQPTKNLKLGIYNMNDLSAVSKWKVRVKYNF